MKSYTTLLTALLLVLLLAPFASADYSWYNTKGNDATMSRAVLGYVRNTTIINYTLIPATVSGGTLTEPVVYDFQNKGKSDIIIQINSSIYLIGGDNVQIVKDSFSGTLNNSPTRCDLNNDGTQEWVGIVNNGTANNILVLRIVNDTFSLLASAHETYPSNVYGNIVCDKFYTHEGDNKNYAFWVDTSKQLHQLSMTGTTLNEVISTPESSDVKEASAPFTVIASSEIIADSRFDRDGEHALIFVAGRYLVAKLSDNTTFSAAWTTGAGITNNTDFVHLLGGINTGSSQTRLAIMTSSSLNTIGLYAEQSIFGFGKNFNNERTLTAIAGQKFFSKMDINFDGIDDLYVAHSDGATVQGAQIFNTNNGNILYSIGGTNNGNAYTYEKKVFTIDYDKVIYGQYVYRPFVSNTTAIQYNFGMTPLADFPTGIPVDINKDGYTDFIFQSPTATNFAISNNTVATTSTALYPFTVSFQNSTNNSATTKITTGWNSTSHIYNYALVCDLSATPLWVESFKTGYNFTTNNVSFNVAPPEGFLTFYGMNFPINATFPQFDLIKYGTTAYRDNLEQTIQYTFINGNNTLDYIAYDDNHLVTYWLRFNRTGTNLHISRENIGQPSVGLANYTLPTTAVTLNIDYAPAHDVGLNRDYFTTTIKNGNVTITTDSTVYYDGTNIKDVELYSDTDSTTILLRTLSLSKISNPHPAFSQFQNGIITTIDGITVTSPPPNSVESGDGFYVYPDYNNTFFSYCSYQKGPGTYTQRHFIAPINTVDYTNYKDFVVTVSNATVSGNITGLNGNSGVITLFNLFGLSATDAFGVWIAISLALGLIVFGIANWTPVGGVFGVLSFIIALIFGAFIDVVPVWVIIIFVLIAGGIMAVLMKKILGG